MNPQDEALKAAREAKARQKLADSGLTPHTPTHRDDDSSVANRRLTAVMWLLVALVAISGTQLGLSLYVLARGEAAVAQMQKSIQQ